MSKARIRIRLYDDRNQICGEYLSVEEIFGFLRCQRKDKLYDLYSLNAELKIIEAAGKIYWAPDGHMVVEYPDGCKNEIWNNNTVRLEAMAV